MPFDGSGNFNRVMNWVSDATAAIKIRADRHDSEDDNFAAGLSNTLTKDGQSQPTANIPMNGKRLISLGAPVNPTDAATKDYVDAARPFTTGIDISGANANGRLKFTSATGINGLSFTAADLGWLARLAGTPSGSLNRLVLNTEPDGSGLDVITFNDNGSATFNGSVTSAGMISSTGSYVDVRNPSGSNAHFRISSTNGSEERMLLYTTSGDVGNVGLRVAGTQNFVFRTDGRFQSPGIVYAGSAMLHTNGNVYGPNPGSVWLGWGAADAYSAISARIEERAQAWANSRADNRISSLQYRKVSEGQIGSGSSGPFRAPAGAVITGFYRSGNGNPVHAMYYMYLQVYDPVRGWVGFTG